MQDTTSHNPDFPPPDIADDLLWRQLKTVPAFRALLRSVEARFYQAVDLPEPILDIGCGDGHFARTTFAEPLTAGVDPWWGPLHKAKKAGTYQVLTQALGHQLPYPDNYFASIISNSVLEHIPNVQEVLNEAGRVLQPGGKLVITMPAHTFTEQLGGAVLLEKMGLNGLANSYRRFFNFIARHVHTDPPEVWASRLANAGFSVTRWQYYFSQKALWALEWGHVQGLPSAVLHFLTGHWIVAPWPDNLRRTERWIRPFYEEATDEGTYLLFVAQKQADGPIQASLPPPNPFTQAELERAEIRDWGFEIEPETAAPPAPAQPIDKIPLPTPDEPTHLPSPISLPPSPLVSGTLVALSILFAALGQSILNRTPPRPVAGLRWYGYSLVALLILVWRHRDAAWPTLSRWRLPRLSRIPRRRWYYLLGLFFVLLAQRVVANTAVRQQPGLALLLWLTAIATTFYALYLPHVSRFKFPVSRFTFIAALTLFLTALIIRAVNLTNHPFILNGVEASIGLDALNVARGVLRNPFSTSWLTNPTLPLFLQAIPIKLLGQSVLAIRFLSPLVGALTVAATYLFGQRLWGRQVGLVAAVLLLGSHFHLHYSRLGMTNIWDPLLVLLALGLVGMAWESEDNRALWLLAGAAVGLNAYLFTSSRLLPLMLAALFLLALLFDRVKLQQQAAHLVAAAALSLVVALPQLLYYNNNPTIFMERFNTLGVLDGQSGWLTQEAAGTGVSRSEVFREQLWQGLLAFNYGQDNSPSYRTQSPLLGFGPAIFFVLGLITAVLRLRQFRYNLLLVWVVVTLVFAGVLLVEPPNSHRLVIATPALSLLAAVALVEFGRFLFTDEQASSSILLPVLLAIAILFSLNDMMYYFGRYQNQHNFGDRNTEIADSMAGYLNTLDEEWTAYFYGPPSMYVSFPTIPFLAADFQAGYNLFDVAEPGADLPAAPTSKLVFIALPERANELESLQTRYPGGRIRTFDGYYADPLFYAYEVHR